MSTRGIYIVYLGFYHEGRDPVLITESKEDALDYARRTRDAYERSRGGYNSYYVDLEYYELPWPTADDEDPITINLETGEEVR